MRVPNKYADKIVVAENGCWLCTAAINNSGYAHIYFEGKVQPAHIAIYKLLVGPIPEGLQLDHLCKVKNCVNPEHLEPVTAKENLLRGSSPNMQTHVTKVCQRGHKIYGKNDYNNRCYKCHMDSKQRRLAIKQQYAIYRD